MQTPSFKKPTRADLEEAVHKTVPDLIAPNLKILFCGINPGLWSGATGHHFAKPGNRFWRALHAGGFTDRVLHPAEKAELLTLGYGITNVVMRTTVSADQLTNDELIAGGRALQRKVKKYRPAVVAFLGIGAYRAAFGRPKAKLGRQDETLADAAVWVLPNPSGLNAHYTPTSLGAVFRELRLAVEGK